MQYLIFAFKDQRYGTPLRKDIKSTSLRTIKRKLKKKNCCTNINATLVSDFLRVTSFFPVFSMIYLML